jgi:hypothetical protein
MEKGRGIDERIVRGGPDFVEQDLKPNPTHGPDAPPMRQKVHAGINVLGSGNKRNAIEDAPIGLTLLGQPIEPVLPALDFESFQKGRRESRNIDPKLASEKSQFLNNTPQMSDADSVQKGGPDLGIREVS